MNIEINWLAVLVATVVSMVLAKTWFRERTFGTVWRQLTGITPADSKKAGKKPIIITLFANIITVLALAALIDISFTFFKSSSVWYALLVGFAAWLAFSATTLATHNAFEQKRLKLTLINNGYQLVFFLSVALIIGWFGV
ncbi:MAG TPA: DUF1761 domain-containing protein [Candidatus Saccharimonadales bacterium]|nr:DUF1761 domain-containing protein [Candidatus Saccharimonadales bacterium]